MTEYYLLSPSGLAVRLPHSIRYDSYKALYHLDKFNVGWSVVQGVWDKK